MEVGTDQAKTARTSLFLCIVGRSKASAFNADAGLIEGCMTQKNFFKSSPAYKPAT
jgi:hypothetical protein